MPPFVAALASNSLWAHPLHPLDKRGVQSAWCLETNTYPAFPRTAKRLLTLPQNPLFDVVPETSYKVTTRSTVGKLQFLASAHTKFTPSQIRVLTAHTSHGIDSQGGNVSHPIKIAGHTAGSSATYFREIRGVCIDRSRAANPLNRHASSRIENPSSNLAEKGCKPGSGASGVLTIIWSVDRRSLPEAIIAIRQPAQDLPVRAGSPLAPVALHAYESPFVQRSGSASSRSAAVPRGR